MAAHSTMRILYVDDSAFDRALVRDALSEDKDAFSLTVADNREQFENLLPQGRWDLVLSDFNILGFDGLQVLETVQAIDPNLPVVIITGTGSEEVAAEAIKRGAADYVMKSAKHIRRLPLTIRSVLEKLRLQTERSQTLAELEAVLEATADGILVVDEQRDLVTCNRKFQELWRIPDALMARDDNDRRRAFMLDQVADPNAYMAAVETLYAQGGQTSQDIVPLKDGRVFERYSQPQLINGKAHGRVWSFRDISADRQQSHVIRRLNRLYAALSEINHAIAVVDTREGLFAGICKALVEKGRFQMAWIGLNDPQTHIVQVASHYGDIHDYLRAVIVRSDDSPEGNGPVGRAIRNGTPCVFSDFAHAQSSRPWHAAAARSGFRACAGFPIREQGVVCGALAVYSNNQEFFGTEERQLLEESANNISFAMDHIQGELQRRQVQDALANSENRFRVMFEQTSDALLILDTDTGYFSDCNDAALRMYGIADKQELLRRRPDTVSPPLQPDGRPSADKAGEMIATALASGGHRFEWAHRTAAGTDFMVEVQLTPVFLDDRQLLICNLRDITEK
ncbi:MAG: GAF domain-containing protein, partial [Lysobacteraceae bacterium]